MPTSDLLETRIAPCDLPPEQFRAIGHSLVDSIADFLRGLPDAPTATNLLPDALRSALGQREMPEEGREIAPIIEDIQREILHAPTHNGSPRFLRLHHGRPAPVGAFADLSLR